MADPQDFSIFEPYGGGRGVRITCTVSATVPVGIPGSNNDEPLRRRCRVVNGGVVSAFISFLGTADLSCMEILPGTVETFTLPYSNEIGVTLSGITASNSTTISLVVGKGL